MTVFLPDVKPSTAIQQDYNALSNHCRQTNTPLLLTKNGEADLVVMSIEAYQKITASHKLGQMLSVVDKEIASGKKMRDFDEVFSAIKERIKNA